MPRRVDSDEEDSKPKKTKPNTIKKPRAAPIKSTALSKKTKPVSRDVDSVISAWAKRQTVESLDGIEDVDAISLKVPRRKLTFEVDDGMNLLRSCFWLIVCRF